LDLDWLWPGGPQVEEVGAEVATVVADHAAEPGRQDETSGGEGFADLSDVN
jgi:hypothetical protein